MQTTGNKEVSLYFHIPFCSKKCPYCHFFVLPDLPHLKEPLLTAFLQEWRLRLPELQGHTVVSLYFGGGTPTKWPLAFYQTLLKELQSSLPFAQDCEITLEANPEDVSLELMQGFFQLGINRVSLGVQSFVPQELYTLERTHSSEKACSAIDATYRAGITNISIDLLFDLPHQTVTSFQTTLATLKSLPITHLSLYNLVLEPHTVFFKHKQKITPLLPPDEESFQMLQQALAALEDLGFKRYEISAFARPGYHSRHNVGYWTARPFFGFGPSAFSYWKESRFSNTTSFPTYLQLLEEGKLPVSFQETLDPQEHLHELFAVHLRLCSGVPIDSWEKKWGSLPELLQKKIAALQNKGQLRVTQTDVQLTPLGQLFYDDVASELLK